MTSFLICSLNLGEVDTIYLGRDTPIAYIKGEDASCEYLEVNEIIEDVWGINWQPPCTRKNGYFWFSLFSQHRWLNTDVWSWRIKTSQKTQEEKFEELKVQFPKVFSLNNEDIGHTQLVTMDIDTGDSPSSLSKTLHLAPSSIIIGYSKKLKH